MATRTDEIFNSLDYILDHKLSGGEASERENIWESCLQNCAFIGARKAIMNGWEQERIDDYREWLSIGNYVGEGNSISVVPTFDGALDVALAEYKTEEHSMGRSM